MSGNLGLVPIAESQDKKYLTANTALLRIADAVTAILSVSVASGNATVTADQYQTAVHIQIIDASAAGRTVTLPAVQRGLVVISAHDDNTESVEVVRGSASLVLLPGEVGICSTDGTTNGFAGYVLADSGAPPTLETLTDVEITAPADGQALIYDVGTGRWKNGEAAGGGGGATRLPFSFFVAGTMTDGEELVRWVAPEACSFPAGAADSYAKSGAAATGSTTVSVKKNGVAFGTFVWSASGTAATVTISSTTSFAAGDVLTFVGPATKDATLANVGFTLRGTWG